MQQKLVSQAKAAALCINAATADLIFNNFFCDWTREIWTEGRVELRADWTSDGTTGSGNLFFLQTSVDFWPRRDRKLLNWKILLKVCVQINFLLWYVRGTLSGHQRTVGCVHQTCQQTVLAQIQKTLVLFFFMKCPVPPFSTVYSWQRPSVLLIT